LRYLVLYYDLELLDSDSCYIHHLIPVSFYREVSSAFFLGVCVCVCVLGVREVKALFVDIEDDVMWNFLELYEPLSVSVTSSPTVGLLLLLTELLKRDEKREKKRRHVL